MKSQFQRSHGAEMAMLLLNSFHVMTDEVIAALEALGHTGVRPVHAFALEAIAAGATSASELGRRLSVSKQAAAKTIAALDQLGYVTRGPHPTDARRKQLQVTPHGFEMLTIGGSLFDKVHDDWTAQVGAPQLASLRAHLLKVTAGRTARADDVVRGQDSVNSLS